MVGGTLFVLTCSPVLRLLTGGLRRRRGGCLGGGGPGSAGSRAPKWAAGMRRRPLAGPGGGGLGLIRARVSPAGGACSAWPGR
jgi:hypothetical protein